MCSKESSLELLEQKITSYIESKLITWIFIELNGVQMKGKMHYSFIKKRNPHYF